jgi:RNA polymerase sigma factor (sigma-70 family)
MPDGPLHKAIRRTLDRLQNAEELTDGQLLERFVSERDEGAFEALLRRHGPMVLRVCRRLLHDPNDAEEAFQATFIVLVRKAAAIGRRDLVGGWLHGVASRIALKARSQASQRRSQEQPVESLTLETLAHEDPAGNPGWNDLRPVLDEELGRLPEKYRTPMVLCYLEGKTNTEAAQQLGWARWTTATRLARGRALLKRRLTRRGLELSGVALAALLTHEAVAAQEPGSTVVILKLSAAGSATLAGNGGAASLAEAVINVLFWSKVKAYGLIAATLTVVLVLGSTLAFLPGVLQDAPSTRTDDHPVQLGVNASLGGKRPFPDDNPWNQEVAGEPVDPNSDALLARIGLDKPLRPEFGTTANGAPFGIPYVVVAGKQPRVAVRFNYEAESDPGPYPIPPDAPIEAGPIGDENRHMIVLDRDNWKLYEMLAPRPDGPGWRAATGASFDLNSNKLRPWGATSADGAGLPIFPGLVRYDEVIEQRAIRHALRFTVRQTRRAFVAPARHYASMLKDPDLPPMGMRVRLKADYDISTFPPSAQVILSALKRYGMFVASHGPDWGLSGAPDPRWNDAELRTLERVKGKDFEVVRMNRIEAREMPPPGER